VLMGNSILRKMTAEKSSQSTTAFVDSIPDCHRFWGGICLSVSIRG
jgi:hypothetical protein